MRLATLVEEFLADLGWVDGIETEERFEGDAGLRVITEVRITIENQIYRLFIDTIEKSQWLMLTLYPPYKVNEGKYVDAIKTALQRKDDIARILKEVSGREVPPGWSPFDAICAACGRRTSKH